MKTYTLLAITLCIAGLSQARPNAHTNVVFGNGFGGATFSDFEYSVPVEGSEVWAGFGNSDDSIYPIVMESGATITFDAYSVSNTPANCRIRFEYNPFPDVDPSYDTPSVTISNNVLTTYSINVPSQGTNTFSSFLFYNETFGQTIYMTNFTITGLDDGDTTPPSPSPSSFSSAPTALSDSSITMTATTTTDADNAVLYYFTCTTDSTFDSGWISESTYIASGLSAATTYEFTVQARDDSYAENTATVSTVASATTTFTDTVPPTPNPMTGSIDASPATVQITATVATDDSPVEYQFVNTSGNGPSSDWQSSNVFIAHGLAQETEYAYTVQARDLSAATNTTAASEAYTVTTGTSRERSRSDSLTDSLHAVAKNGLQIVSLDEARSILVNSNGAHFGSVTAGDGGRNYLATIANNFDEYDFTVEVTVDISSADQQAFLGIGRGGWVHINFLIMVMQLVCYYVQVQEGENSTYASDQFGNVVSGSPGTSIWNPEDDTVNAGAGLGVHRLQLVNDTTAGTLTFNTDTNYNGTFTIDQIEGSLDITEVWNPSLNPTQNPNYDVDEEVFVPYGQNPTAATWEENSGGGGGSVNTFPTSGGSGDDGAYFQMDSTAGSWSVGVVSTNSSDPGAAEYLPFADYGFAPEQLITFQMDMKEFSNPSGSATGGIKIEFYDTNGATVGQIDRGGWSDWPERKVEITSEWATYRWQIGVPQGTDFMKIVPVQHDEVSI